MRLKKLSRMTPPVLSDKIVYKKRSSIRVFLLGSLLMSCLLITESCQDEETAKTLSTKLVGNEGGEITGSDGLLTINFPEGAVDTNTTVGIQQTTEVAPNGIGKIYTLTPEGTEFAKPVKLSFQYTDADLLNTPASSMAIAFKDGNEWKVMETLEIDESSKTITTETTHFSQWTLLKVPSITTFTPASGVVGTVVSISGTNFSATPSENKVFFNGQQATVLSSSITSLTVNVPSDATSGKIIVSTLLNGVNYTVVSSRDFTVLSEPTITSFTPTSGKIGTSVTITGTGFSSVVSENKVLFNGQQTTVLSASSTALVVNVPTGASSGKITVTTLFNNLDFSITSSNDFTVVNNDPTITGFTPTSGIVGTTVTITGTDFSTIFSENKVLFNGQQATVLSASSTALVVNVPTVASSGKITVTTVSNNLDFSITSANDFTVVNNDPTITGFTPSSGIVGTSVTITGTNFSAIVSENKVFFNGQQATVSSASSTALVVNVPTGASSGKITVTTVSNNLDFSITSANNFTVVNNDPTITGFTPGSGIVGTSVTITGTGFSTVVSENKVFFNGQQATVSSASSTALVANVPTGASSGKITVTTVFNNLDFSITSANNFTVVNNDPTITGFTPASGIVGTSVTITGTNFSAIVSENKVFFNGQQATVSSVSSTALVVNVPTGASSGKILITTVSNGVDFTVTSTTDFTVNR